MQLPYESIINLMKEISSSKSNKIFTFIRKRNINKIINILKDSLNKENIIYKKDLVNFYNFMIDISKIIGENLIEFSDINNVYLYKKDNVNYGFRFAFSDAIYSSSTYCYIITIETCDTVNEYNAYFNIHAERIYTFDKSIDKTTQWQTTYLNSKVQRDCSNDIYNLIIETIIKYLNYFKEYKK